MEWEQKLKDKYGLSDYQADGIKEIFKVTILDISEATKNNETLNETIWEAGVVELIKNSEQIGENLLMNSIFQLSACLLDRTIRQSLEQNLNNSSQSSSELSNKFYESTTFSTSDQLIDKKTDQFGEIGVGN